MNGDLPYEHGIVEILFRIAIDVFRNAMILRRTHCVFSVRHFQRFKTFERCITTTTTTTVQTSRGIRHLSLSLSLSLSLCMLALRVCMGVLCHCAALLRCATVRYRYRTQYILIYVYRTTGTRVLRCLSGSLDVHYLYMYLVRYSILLKSTAAGPVQVHAGTS